MADLRPFPFRAALAVRGAAEAPLRALIDAAELPVGGTRRVADQRRLGEAGTPCLVNVEHSEGTPRLAPPHGDEGGDAEAGDRTAVASRFWLIHLYCVMTMASSSVRSICSLILRSANAQNFKMRFWSRNSIIV